MSSQCPPVVRQIEVQQARALVRGSLRRVLTLFGLPQTRLRLFVHLVDTRRTHTLFYAIRISSIKPMPPFLYRCPNTGDNVQAWAADDPEDDDLTYVQVTCLACAQAHLVDPKSGRVLGAVDDE